MVSVWYARMGLGFIFKHEVSSTCSNVVAIQRDFLTDGHDRPMHTTNWDLTMKLERMHNVSSSNPYKLYWNQPWKLRQTWDHKCATVFKHHYTVSWMNYMLGISIAGTHFGMTNVHWLLACKTMTWNM